MEIVIKDNCEFEDFYKILHKLKGENITIIEDVHGFDSIYIDFLYIDYMYTIHYNIYCGVSLYPKDTSTFSKRNKEEIMKLALKLIETPL